MLSVAVFRTLSERKLAMLATISPAVLLVAKHNHQLDALLLQFILLHDNDTLESSKEAATDHDGGLN